MWNWLLVKLGLRVDWSNPDNAPPAFEDTASHVYEQAEGLVCCRHCGGGRNHPIHA